VLETWTEKIRDGGKRKFFLLISVVTSLVWKWGSSVSIATDYKLESQVSFPGSVKTGCGDDLAS
jgi:hypothetical protein